MAFTEKIPLVSLLCLLILTVGTFASLKEQGEEAVKEIGSHGLREAGHKLWEWLSSEDLWDKVQEYAEDAKDVALDAAQVVLDIM